MPRVSPFGVPAMGIGDGVVSIAGVVPVPLTNVIGGGTVWVRRTGIIFQDNTTGIPSLWTYTPGDAAPIKVSLRGANRLEAGGGIWAAWNSVDGYFDSLGRTSKSWYPLAVDDLGGTVAVCLDYATGTGLGLLPPQAVTPFIVEAGPLDRISEGETSYREGVLAYRAGGALRFHFLDGSGRPNIVSALPVGGARQHQGIAVGWSPALNATVVYRVGETHGAVVAEGDHDFNPDIWVDPASGLVKVFTSATAGERPQDLKQYVVNLATAPQVDLTVVARPPLPVVPSRALWRGLEGGAPRAAGNVTWGFVDDRPVMESEPWVSQAWSPLQRQVRWILFLPHNYSSKEFGYPDVATYAAATAATAKRLGVPVVVYWDGPTYEGWSWLQWFEAQHLPVLRGVQCYPLAGEALGDTVWRITNTLTAHRHYKDLIIRPVYAPLGVSLVFQLQAHLDRLCNTLTHIVGDFGFGRSRRPECFDLWPDFQAYWTALCAATPVPVIPPAPLPPAPPALDPLLMSVLTLKRSKFVDGSYAADRGGKLYRLSNGKNMSIQEADGLPRTGGLPANGPSETFFLKGDRAYVEFDDIRYTFLVAD